MSTGWKVAAVEALIILVLSYVLWGAYGPGARVSTTTSVDTTQSRTVVDTNWVTLVDSSTHADPEPDSTIRAGQTGHPVPDTVYQDTGQCVVEVPPLRRYRERYQGEFYDARVTSWVTGSLDSQRVRVDVTRPEIILDHQTVINRHTTRTVEQWRLTGALLLGGSPESFSILAPGIGIQRPGKISLQYHFDLVHRWHLINLNTPVFGWQ